MKNELAEVAAKTPISREGERKKRVRRTTPLFLSDCCCLQSYMWDRHVLFLLQLEKQTFYPQIAFI